MKMTYAPVVFLLMLFPVSMIEITPQRDYPIRPVAFTQVKITDSFWQPRLETNRRVTIPFAFKKCEETARMPGPFQGKRYNDSDVYKIIEGAAYSLSLERDPELAKYFLEVRGQRPYPQRFPEDSPFAIYNQGWYLQAHRPVLEQIEAIGHAVRAMYMYSGMADVAALLGDERFGRAGSPGGCRKSGDRARPARLLF